MSIYYLSTITLLTTLDLVFLWFSIRSKTWFSVAGLIGLTFLAVMFGEYYREIRIFLTGIVPPPSYFRAKVMLHEGILFGVLFQEVRIQYEKLHRKTS